MAAVPSIWSELLHAMWHAGRRVGAKKASIKIGERYATGPTSVFYGARDA